MTKTLKLTLLPFLLIQVTAMMAQSYLPVANLKTLNGSSITLKSVIDSSAVSVISFWATWCVPCINELDAIQERIDNKKEEKLFQLIAISTDEARTVKRVNPMVKTKGWNFEIYLDETNEVKRSLNVSNIPFLIIFQKGKIVYQRSGYVPGDEEILFDKIKQLTAGNQL
jgi:thiol-disulfide isomerase/thioredoxin